MSTPKTAAWLEKFGWTPGSGLGKNLDGRKNIIYVTKKDDKVGLGQQGYSLFDFSHWDNLYNQAVKKIQITTDDQGAQLKTATETKPTLQAYNGKFVKATSSSFQSQTSPEAELFKHCGKRELRIYRQEGKMSRLRKFETGQYEYHDGIRKEQQPPVEDNLETGTNYLEEGTKKTSEETTRGKKRKREESVEKKPKKSKKPRKSNKHFTEDQ